MFSAIDFCVRFAISKIHSLITSAQQKPTATNEIHKIHFACYCCAHFQAAPYLGKGGNAGRREMAIKFNSMHSNCVDMIGELLLGRKEEE